jgi:hypothetical protein
MATRFFNPIAILVVAIPVLFISITVLSNLISILVGLIAILLKTTVVFFNSISMLLMLIAVLLKSIAILFTKSGNSVSLSTLYLFSCLFLTKNSWHISTPNLKNKFIKSNKLFIVLKAARYNFKIRAIKSPYFIKVGAFKYV